MSVIPILECDMFPLGILCADCVTLYNEMFEDEIEIFCLMDDVIGS